MSPDPFEGLDFDAVHWASLTHAYGGAEAVPFLIRALVSADAEERSEALDELCGSIFHQGTVFAASAPAIPFLARAAVVAPGDRAQIGLLISAMSRAYAEDWTDPTTPSGAVRAQIGEVVGELAPLLADPDRDVRRAMMRILAVCPPARVRTLVDLREFDDADEFVRADALMAWVRLEHDSPDLPRRLEDGLLDGSPAVRQAAAATVLAISELPYPPEIVTALADSIAAVGDINEEFGDESWDRLPASLFTDPDEAEESKSARGVLELLGRDPDTALAAAARIAGGGTARAVQGAYLVDDVYEHWRGKEEPVAAVLAQFLSTAPDIRYPGAYLRRLARCAIRIGDPDPALAAGARRWTEHEDGDVVSSALTALARLREPDCLDMVGRALGSREHPCFEMTAVSEVFGEHAATLVPRLRERLSGMQTSQERSAAHIAQALPLLGTAALVAVPDLLGLIETGRMVRPAIRALAQFGPAAVGAADGRDVAAVIEAAYAAAEDDFDRMYAASALSAVASDDALARRMAADLAGRARWENFTVVQLGRLGPAAAVCAARIAEGLDSPNEWTEIRAAEAYWRITGETALCARVLARHVSETPAGQESIEVLLEMRHFPEQAFDTLHHLAHAPRRLAHDGRQDGSMHADDVLRDNARALLDIQYTAESA